MNAIATTQFTVTCRCCGTENHLTITAVPGDQPVSCSRCEQHLGTVEELSRGLTAKPVAVPIVGAEVSAR